jgi:hypothetical protein
MDEADDITGNQRRGARKRGRSVTPVPLSGSSFLCLVSNNSSPVGTDRIKRSCSSKHRGDTKEMNFGQGEC